MQEQVIEAVIPNNGSCSQKYKYNFQIYKERYLVKFFLEKIENWYRIATRYEKTLQVFEAMGFIASLLGGVLKDERQDLR